MNIPYRNPDDYVSVFDNQPCPFHKIAPGEPYAGCTCSGSYYQRLATPEERKANVAAREAREKRAAEAYRAIGALLFLLFVACSTPEGSPVSSDCEAPVDDPYPNYGNSLFINPTVGASFDDAVFWTCWTARERCRHLIVP